MIMRLLIICLFLIQYSNAFCYYGTQYLNHTGCFQFFRTPLNFTNALRFCRVNMKSTLVRNLTPTMNQQLKEAAYKLGVEEYWIGASNVDNDWEWLDGSVMKYSNFDVVGGYPKMTESQTGAVAMISLGGMWYTRSDSMKLPFVCEITHTDDYDQGILYRTPKTQGLRFPYGGAKAPVELVQSVDQSSLYPKKGPVQNEIDTGEKAYLKPIDTMPQMDMMQEQPMIILNPRKIRKKVKPVIVSETETVIDRSRKEKEELEHSLNMKSKGGNTKNANSSAVEEELSSNSKSNREREEKESIRSKTVHIQRG